MSRVGKQIITIPAGVEVNLSAGVLTVKGPKGSLTREFKDGVAININNNEVTFTPKNEDDKKIRALWGTYASHVKNMVQGVTEGFSKKLILEGVGFKSEVSGDTLVLALGFSHPVKLPIPKGLTVTAEKNNITVSGIDKELVGSFASFVRSNKKPEPYKGKGFRYDDEVIRRKQGKKAS
ncbi:MAG: 50S ribosomal protein L6 [Candidatus Moranbacteria bacterium]|nr:50S ribosomal protein L6 [Candidatus Moranbacteria bacterium]